MVQFDFLTDNEWEAGFLLNDDKMSATFDGKGNWLETEKEIGTEELPAPVTTTLADNYGDYEIKEAAFMEFPDHTCYEVTLVKDKAGLELLIDSNGVVLEKGSEEEG